jgi:ribosomal protein L37AE/L43A
MKTVEVGVKQREKVVRKRRKVDYDFFQKQGTPKCMTISKSYIMQSLWKKTSCNNCSTHGTPTPSRGSTNSSQSFSRKIKLPARQ